MEVVKPTVRELFMAERSAAVIEDHTDSMGLSIQPYSDIDTLTCLPLKMFEMLFTLKVNQRGGNRREDLRDAFLEMDNFDDFWRIYGANIVWRRDNG